MNRPSSSLTEDIEVIKQPWGDKPPWIRLEERGSFTFEHAVLTKRDPLASAQSQAYRFKLKHGIELDIPERIRKIETQQCKLREWLNENIPNVVEVQFPVIVDNFDHLWYQTSKIVGKRASERQAKKVWESIRNPDFVRF